MKIVKRAAVQGDVGFRRVKAVPDGFKATETKAEVVVAHSETGHHHVAVAERPFSYYTNPAEPLLAYIKFDKKTQSIDIVHQRDYHQHEAYRLLGEPESVWEIRRQREATPDGWRRAAD